VDIPQSPSTISIPPSPSYPTSPGFLSCQYPLCGSKPCAVVERCWLGSANPPPIKPLQLNSSSRHDQGVGGGDWWEKYATFCQMAAIESPPHPFLVRGAKTLPTYTNSTHQLTTDVTAPLSSGTSFGGQSRGRQAPYSDGLIRWKFCVVASAFSSKRLIPPIIQNHERGGKLAPCLGSQTARGGGGGARRLPSGRRRR